MSPIPLTKNHLYDKQTQKIIAALPYNGNCIDVGCYKGEILDLMLKAAPRGKHYGVEPIPDKYKDLEAKYHSVSNCTVLNFAATDQEGTADFNFVISNPSYSGLLKRDYDRPEEQDKTITVSTDLLDNLIPADLKIDLIKIDVEGAELQVLRGAKGIIRKCKPIVVFEHGLGASEHYGTTPELIFDYFASMDMYVSNLGEYIKTKGKNHLSLEQLSRQYHEQQHYYFVAHP